MWYVVLSILTNVLLLVWLRSLRLPVFSLITLNYLVCVGLALGLDAPRLNQIASLPLATWGLIGVLGGLFIGVFALTGQASREIGVGLTGMIAKLSVILPVAFVALFLGEPLYLKQVLGMVAGLMAIVLVHRPYWQAWPLLLQHARIGLLLWAGNGTIDILFKAGQPLLHPLSPLQVPLFVMSVAGLIGLIEHLRQNRLLLLLQGALWKGALLLGTTNLLSIYAYLQALQTWPAAQFFLWNNLGIVLLSGVVGIVFFRERFSWEVGAGYALGGLALILLA